MNSVQATEWCFEEEQASELVYKLDSEKNCQESLALCIEANSAIEEKSALQSELDGIKNNIIVLKNEESAVKTSIIEEQKNLISVKNQQIKDATPTFWRKLGWGLQGALAGTAIAFAAVLIL